MSESLFQISCPSCESVFAVTDPELVGQIIACPKCGGMMLVEAAKVAPNGPAAQDSEIAADANVGEVAQNGESFSNVEPSASETAQEARGVEYAQNGENGEEVEPGDEENAAPVERSRSGGKFVASGIALALVGALAFGGLRVFNGESTPTAETNVGAENGENSEDSENSEGEKNGEDASNGAQDDVGGFAPRAVEERSGEKESETEFWSTDSPELEGGKNAESAEVGENKTTEASGEDAQSLSVATDAVDEKTTLETENGEVGEVGEVGENVASGTNGEDASNETEIADENAPSFDETTEGLEGLGELGGLNEGESLDDEESEEADALEDVDEETAEKLAGSNEATCFNEADFERANQNDDSENADELAEVDWSAVASTTNPTLQGALPTLRREKKEIDVDARLALPIKSIEFPSSPVAAIRLLSEFSGVSIVPDLDAFVLTRPSTNATLDLSLRDTTAGEALEKIADLLNWEVCREQDRILIRPSDYDPATLVEERFNVADLTTPRAQRNDETRLEMFEAPNNLTPEALAALIKSTVAPETWSENGGNANLTVDGTTLAISQCAQNREKTRILLEGLRAIRGLEAQGDATPERVIPEKLGWEKLTKKTNFLPLEPVALQNAIEILEKSQKFQTLWDDAALLEAGVGRDLSTAARVENGTIDAVLREILEPFNASYIILGENLVLVTEKEVARKYQTVEFFSLIGENGERPTLDEARALVEEIKVAIAPESRRKSDAAREENGADSEEVKDAEKIENGEEDAIASKLEFGEDALNNASGENGENASSSEEEAAIWLDVESSCLIVRQNQPNQRALRRWLDARLANSASKEKKAN